MFHYFQKLQYFFKHDILKTFNLVCLFKFGTDDDTPHHTQPRAVHQCNICNKIFVSFKGKHFSIYYLKCKYLEKLLKKKFSDKCKEKTSLLSLFCHLLFIICPNMTVHH